MSRLTDRIRTSGSHRLRHYRASLRAWWHRKLRPRPFLFTDRSQISLQVHPHDDLQSLFYFRTHFDDLGALRAVSRILQPGMTVFDVGANQGQFSLFAARHVTSTGKIHTFEPSSSAWSRLQTNLACNARLASRIEANRTAVADRAGVAQLYQYAENSAWNSLHPHGRWSNLEQREAGAPAITPAVADLVPTITLDNYCQQAAIPRIDFLKIDVEGFELSVMRGAAAALQQHSIRHLMYEICTDLLAAVGQTPQDVVGLLQSYGYETKRIGPNGSLEDLPQPGEFPFLANYLARPLAPQHAAS